MEDKKTWVGQPIQNDDVEHEWKKRVIWKYPLEIMQFQTVEMPVSVKILTVQTQRNKPFLWAIVDETAPRVPVGILMFGTGWKSEMLYNCRHYIGSFQCKTISDGDFVGHVFLESDHQASVRLGSDNPYGV